ncbi:hypothetical protein HDU76_005783 [Blyttiomyces sp. JEL0837]|nr:hypothetical protein HDU76_005783 [Blyttiomyces sp. JEL0837]
MQHDQHIDFIPDHDPDAMKSTTATLYNSNIRFPEYLLPVILSHIKYDRRTLIQGRMVSQGWLAVTDPFVFERIQLTFDNTDPFNRLIRHWTSQTSPHITSSWTKYVHYIQIKAPDEPYYPNPEEQKRLRFVYFKWCKGLREAIGSCVNLRGLFSERQFFPGMSDTRINTTVDWGVTAASSNHIAYLNLSPFKSTFSFLIPSTNSSWDSAAKLNSTFATNILKDVGSFTNVRFLHLDFSAIYSDSVNFSLVSKFINLESLSIIEVNKLKSVGTTLTVLTRSLPPSLKSLSLHVSSKDVELFGESPLPDLVPINQDLHIREFQLEMYPSMNRYFGISLPNLKLGFKRLCDILPFDHADIFRLVSGVKVLVCQEPENISTSLSTRSQQINLPHTFNHVVDIWDSSVWLGMSPSFLNDVESISASLASTYDSVMHLQLEVMPNFQAAILPFNECERFYERLQSFSMISLPDDDEGLNLVLNILNRMKNISYFSLRL